MGQFYGHMRKPFITLLDLFIHAIEKKTNLLLIYSNINLHNKYRSHNMVALASMNKLRSVGSKNMQGASKHLWSEGQRFSLNDSHLEVLK